MTYWATGLALGAITAIDVSDPTQPRIVYTGIAGFPVNHGVEFSADGRRMYLATIFPGGVIAYDISDIQDRVPSPRIHELGRVSWNPTSAGQRSEEHPSELQSLMRISYAVFCLNKKTPKIKYTTQHTTPT